MKHYRLKLFPGANIAADKAILAAATSNGGNGGLSLKNIKAIGEAENCPDTSFEIIGETKMHIDTKIGNGWETVAIIEQVQIMEIQETVDDLPNYF